MNNKIIFVISILFFLSMKINVYAGESSTDERFSESLASESDSEVTNGQINHFVKKLTIKKLLKVREILKNELTQESDLEDPLDAHQCRPLTDEEFNELMRQLNSNAIDIENYIANIDCIIIRAKKMPVMILISLSTLISGVCGGLYIAEPEGVSNQAVETCMITSTFFAVGCATCLSCCDICRSVVERTS